MSMNIRKTTSIILSDREFLITHWSPTKVMTNLPKIGRYFAVPLSTVAGSLMTGGQNLAEVLPAAVIYLFEQMEADDINKLFDLILADTTIGGVDKKIDIDETFQDNVMDLITLTTKVLEVNYGCFFEKGGFASLQGLMSKLGMVHQVNQMDEAE